MQREALAALVEFYLPVLVTAGDYARNVQTEVGRPTQKDGENAWASALTDADLMVQHYIEIATLAHQPGIGFFGEEHDQSRNTKYFSSDADTVVHLDPINGTYLYQHQRDGWDIVLSIRHAGRLVAAISYMPARGRFYLGIDRHGALTGDREVRTLRDFGPLQTCAGSRAFLTYHVPDLNRKALPEFDCFDIVEDDDPARNIDNLNDLFTGRLGAFACRDVALLDWGAAAYIAMQAGGCVSRLDGSPFTAFDDYDLERKADMLVSADTSTHRRILELLI